MRINKDIELLQGDCVELMAKIPDESIDAIVTDPPYFLGMTHNGKRGCFNDLAICKPFYQNLFLEFKRVLKQDACVYFFCDWRSIAFYYPIFNSVLNAKNLLVWKKHGRPSPDRYGHGYEVILFTGKINKSYSQNILEGYGSFGGNLTKTNGKKVHPTQKPIELLERLILDSTNDSDVVLDPLMGSASTGIACINTNRKFIGMEIDEEYFEIAKTRIKDKLTEDKEKKNEKKNGTKLFDSC